jgi:hypothetical protein
MNTIKELAKRDHLISVIVDFFKWSNKLKGKLIKFIISLFTKKKVDNVGEQKKKGNKKLTYVDKKRKRKYTMRLIFTSIVIISTIFSVYKAVSLVDVDNSYVKTFKLTATDYNGNKHNRTYQRKVWSSNTKIIHPQLYNNGCVNGRLNSNKNNEKNNIIYNRIDNWNYCECSSIRRW